MSKYAVWVVAVLFGYSLASAATLYVVTPETPGVTPTTNYTSWATAATNIQQAIDVAAPNDLILVTNGIYYLTRELTLAKAITLRSFANGVTDRAGTVLDGNYPATSNRCLCVSNAAAIVDGFTVTNGYTGAGHVLSGGGGGGIKLYKGTVTNCLVIGNQAVLNGGGMSIFSGGLLAASTVTGNAATNATANDGGYGGGIVLNGGTVRNCVISSNRSGYQGGGLWMYTSGATVEECTIANNHAQPLPGVTGNSGAGGGIWYGWAGTIARCTIVSNSVGASFSGSNIGVAGASVGNGGVLRDSLVAYNSSPGYGGGVAGGTGRTVTNCVIRNNTAGNGGGIYPGSGGLFVACTVVSNSSAAFVQGGIMRNCLFANNSAGIWNQAGSAGTYQNCTIANNGGAGIRFSIPGNVENCIVYNNNAGGSNWSYDGTGSGSTWTNCCTYPLPTGTHDVGVVTNAPGFVTYAGGDYHLTGSSPCIDKGVFRTWMNGAVDLGGSARIIGKAVDMGAFESPPPRGTMIQVF
jgi:hypothetical protein